MAHCFHSIKEHFDSLPTWGKALVGVAVVGGSATILFSFRKKSRKGLVKKDFKPGVVYAFQWSRTACIPNMSPYGLKLETWLRMAGVPYENVEVTFFSSIRSKEGTLPFVEYNGVEYDDSAFIIRDLTKLLKKEAVNGSLSVEQKAVSRSFEQMVENSTLMSIGYDRYMNHFEEIFSEKIIGFPIPFLVKLMFHPFFMRRQLRKRFIIHGIGRHTPEEIANIGLDDIRSISAYLSTKQFFHGDTPTQVDAVLFGSLASVVYIPIETPHQKLINTECRNVARYLDRVKARYWPDWDVICKTRVMNTV